MQKAKSRLKSQELEQKQPKHSSKSTQKLKIGSFLSSHSSGYLKHLPLLLIAIIFYGMLGWMLRNIYPEQIKHLIVPNSYLPLQLALFGGNFFFLSFLFLNTRRGLLASILLALIIFLKLQQVIMSPIFIAVLIGTFAVLELSATLYQYLHHS